MRVTDNFAAAHLDRHSVPSYTRTYLRLTYCISLAKVPSPSPLSCKKPGFGGREHLSLGSHSCGRRRDSHYHSSCCGSGANAPDSGPRDFSLWMSASISCHICPCRVNFTLQTGHTNMDPSNKPSKGKSFFRPQRGQVIGSCFCSTYFLQSPFPGT